MTLQTAGNNQIYKVTDGWVITDHTHHQSTAQQSGANNYDIDGQDENETDKGSTTCGGADEFAGTRLTLANLLDGNFLL